MQTRTHPIPACGPESQLLQDLWRPAAPPPGWPQPRGERRSRHPMRALPNPSLPIRGKKRRSEGVHTPSGSHLSSACPSIGPETVPFNDVRVLRKFFSCDGSYGGPKLVVARRRGATSAPLGSDRVGVVVSQTSNLYCAQSPIGSFVDVQFVLRLGFNSPFGCCSHQVAVLAVLQVRFSAPLQAAVPARLLDLPAHSTRRWLRESTTRECQDTTSSMTRSAAIPTMSDGGTSTPCASSISVSPCVGAEVTLSSSSRRGRAGESWPSNPPARGPRDTRYGKP